MFICLAITALFYACEEDPVVPDQSKIYTSYELTYDETADKTSAESKFFMNMPSNQVQQRLELTYPANVMFEGDELLFNSNDRIYSKEFVGELNGEFLYTNYNGIAFSNELDIPDSLDLFVQQDSVDSQFDFYFEIMGTSLDSNEVYEVEILSLVSGEQLFAEYDSLSTQVIMVTSSQLNDLGIGGAVITASRVATSEPLQINGVGGEQQSRYCLSDTIVVY